jgi:hypothetical protein
MKSLECSEIIYTIIRHYLTLWVGGPYVHYVNLPLIWIHGENRGTPYSVHVAKVRCSLKKMFLKGIPLFSLENQ